MNNLIFTATTWDKSIFGKKALDLGIIFSNIGNKIG